MNPRSPRLAAHVVVLATFAGLVTGCGSDRPENLPPTDDPVVWAGRLCSSLGPLTGLRNLRPHVDPNDPGASKASLSQYFNDTEGRIGESLEGLDQVGPSPIPGGDDVTGRVRAALQRLHKAFEDAKFKVDNVDTSDPVALGTRLPEILTGLADAAKDKDLSTTGDNEALNDAVRQSPSCAMIKGASPSVVSGTN
ncbi:MAG TPA: hypothetical protein VIQ30_01125 [Pseudonocardia sp.]